MKIREIFSDDVEEGEDCGGEAHLDEPLRGEALGHGGGRGDDECEDEEFWAAWRRDACGGEARLDEALHRAAFSHGGEASGHGGGEARLDEALHRAAFSHGGEASGHGGGEARLDEALRGGALGHGGGEALRGGPLGHGGSGEEGAEDQWEDDDWEEARLDEALRGGPSGRGGSGGGEASGSGRGGSGGGEASGSGRGGSGGGEASGSGRGGGGWLGKLVGVGARLALYPSLAYNVARNKMEAEFHWWDQVDEHIWLGAVPFQRHVPRLKAIGVRGVVTLNEPFETFVTSSVYQDHDIENLRIPTRDYACAPSLENIYKALEFINRNALQGNSTYVHCKAGRGRSTTVVLCYLIKYKGMDAKQAWVHTKSIRPRICLTSAQQKAVTLFSTLNPVGADIASQSSAGVVARQRPNTRQIQPEPVDHLEP